MLEELKELAVDGADYDVYKNNYTHLLEWSHRIAKRPGVQKGLAAEYQSLGK